MDVKKEYKRYISLTEASNKDKKLLEQLTGKQIMTIFTAPQIKVFNIHTVINPSNTE